MKRISFISICLSLFLSAQMWAGSIFLTGHDPDFHAAQPNGTLDSIGAVHINQVAINYVTNSAFNPYTAGGLDKFLFVESTIAIPSGHRIGMNGIIASGFTHGTDFERHTAATLAGELALLGTKYNAVVVASDFGGLLTQAELDILNSNSAGIINFLNDGGGLYAMSQSNNGAGLTPGGGHFGFLPFVVSSTGLNQSESGNVLTPFGASLGLVTTDITSNFSHNIFNGTSGLGIVDYDSQGQILTLAGRGTVTGGGVNTPDSGSTMIFLGAALMGLIFFRKKLK